MASRWAARHGRRASATPPWRVIVGAGAKILGPITIGRGTRVGANSVVIDSTPPEVTVVGIPAKVVRPESSRRRRAGRIDLDHHLMPDPVGEAIAVVLDRVEFLEARLAYLQQRLRDASLPVRDDKDGAPCSVLPARNILGGELR
jgi:serine O-acetyltransferase